VLVVDWILEMELDTEEWSVVLIMTEKGDGVEDVVLSRLDETDDETLLDALGVYVDVEVGFVYDIGRLGLDWDAWVADKLSAGVLVCNDEIFCEAVLLWSTKEDIEVAYEVERWELMPLETDTSEIAELVVLVEINTGRENVGVAVIDVDMFAVE
jgi:hypothetical protein